MVAANIPDQAQSRPAPLVARRSRLYPDANFTAAKTAPDDLDMEEEKIQPPRRQTAVPTPRRGAASSVRARQRFHLLFLVGLALLIMLFGWVALSALSTWWQTTQDDWHYGRPRTYQTDAVVGHRDSTQNPSHFIAINLNRHILIVEIPGGDTSKMVVYSGPILLGPGQDLTPVTLSFQDINHDGKVDMVVNVAGNRLMFLNENGGFVVPASTVLSHHYLETYTPSLS